jgi:hypothetical protein
MAGMMAPNKFPRCGLPLLCIPVRMRDMAAKIDFRFVILDFLDLRISS